MSKQEKLYSTATAAEYMGMGQSTLRYFVQTRQIEPQMVGHSLIYTERQLIDFIVERERKSKGRQLRRELAGKPTP